MPPRKPPPRSSRPPAAQKRRTAARPRAAQLAPKALPQNPFFALLGAVQSEVDQRLRGFLETRLDVAQSHGPEVVEMVSAVRELCLRGGWRLRPALVFFEIFAQVARAEL